MENKKNRNKLAIWSFGLTGWGLFFTPLMFVGFILAIISLTQIKKTGEEGKEFAIIAIVMFAVVFIFLLFTGIMAGQQAAQSEEIARQVISNNYIN